MAKFYKSCIPTRRSHLCLWCPVTTRQHTWPRRFQQFLPLSCRTCSFSSSDKPEPRINPIHIKMLPERLHRHIFKGKTRSAPTEEAIDRSIRHLKEHSLWGLASGDALEDVDFKLPKLYGRNIDEHFRILAMKQSDAYAKLAEALTDTPLPPMPAEWAFRAGWTRYCGNGDKTEVDFPQEQAIVFDVECLMTGPTEGRVPTMAAAVSSEAWYSWCSDRLIADRLSLSSRITPSDLIPLETPASSTRPPQETTSSGWQKRLVIGHNVSFDRSYVKEQYLLKGTKTRFLDTMSLHMAVAGMTTYQRALWLARRTGKGAKTQYLAKKAAKKTTGPTSTEWVETSSPNNLSDVYALYSQDKDGLDKSQRDTFVTGNMEEVRDNFQELMTYCAKDVHATHTVFTVLLPKFFQRFPHPVTFAAMLEMGQAYLPVDRNWDRYLRESQETFDDLQQEMKLALMHLANDACQLVDKERYKDDLWLWELDWSTDDYRLNKEITKKTNKLRGGKSQSSEESKEAERRTQDGILDEKHNAEEVNKLVDLSVSSSDARSASVGDIEFQDKTSRLEAGFDDAGWLTEDETDNGGITKENLSDEATTASRNFELGSLDKISRKEETEIIDEMMTAEDEENLQEEEEAAARQRLEVVKATASRMPKVKQHMVGYPMWYRELCPRKMDADWSPGPSLISSQVRVAPKLLQLTWDGYPLHYESKHGWGYLVPWSLEDTKRMKEEEDGKEEDGEEEDGEEERGIQDKTARAFPLEALKNLVKERVIGHDLTSAPLTMSEPDELLTVDIDEDFSTNGFQSNGEEVTVRKVAKQSSLGPKHQGQRPRTDVIIPGCWFYRLPHKDGESNKVGNPLAKDFLSKLEDGTLRSAGGAQATRILEINKLISSWRNSSKRICSQMVVDLDRSHFPRAVTRHSDYEEEGCYGAIIPRVVTAGTVTRRAVEPTWLTATNARLDRVGSELKAMIHAPPGYHFVGADVDSQELWIAALLGDANFAGFHGCTAFGWMTLQGKKSDATDMHSVTAATIGISREHAKVMNYGRIYGAGRPFAVRLLMQFNHRLSLEEAQEKANRMYAMTKGVKMFHVEDKAASLLIEHGILKETDDRCVSATRLGELGRHIRAGKRSLLTDGRMWTNGSESAMFNRLETIAHSDHPRTPVLDASISQALEPGKVNNEFMTSRINWVVQSSAVDYLHLMLVCMKWLFEQYNIDGRFCISIHDEVRYLVSSEDRYRAALALQVTNLLTRSMFAYKVGMDDLPQSVAFFSTVDIDTVLRKEGAMDCQTPSNPYGLQRGYGIPQGEALDIHDILGKTNKGSLARSSSSSNNSRSSSATAATGVPQHQ